MLMERNEKVLWSSGPNIGKPVTLTPYEKHHLNYSRKVMNSKLGNALGAEIPITTLTFISKDISQQRFYEIYPADYIPVKVGEGAFDTNTTVYRSFDIADEFETGYVNTGVQSARQAMVDTGVDALNIKHLNWKKTNTWNIFDLKFAAKSGNWDLVTQKEISRKRNWDLGLQRIAFLGARGQNGASGNCLGLLNQPGITTNTTVITKPINTMTTAELKTFTAQLLQSYRANNNYTVMPNRWAIPESEFNGLAATVSPDFPIKTIYELLLEMFILITGKKDFKILPLAYADMANSGFSYQIYSLYNSDPFSLFMSIPLMYTNTLANSLDDFNFQNSAYGQHTGVLVLRPLELMYFIYTP